MEEISAFEQRNKQLNALTKLIHLTQQDQLNWHTEEARSNVLGVSPDDAIKVFFVTTYKGRILRLFERRYKVVPRKPNRSILNMSYDFLSQDTGNYEPYWTKEVVLELVDDIGASSRPFDNVGVLGDLLRAVQYQVTGARGFIDELLSDEVTSGDAE